MSFSSLGSCSFGKKDGQIWAWGRNDEFQLGLGHGSSQYIPALVPLDSLVKIVASGYQHTLFLTQDNKVFYVGTAIHNEKKAIKIPQEISFPKTVIDLCAGRAHSLFVCSDFTIFGLGVNNYGELGNGTRAMASEPVKMNWNPGQKTVSISFALGNRFSIILVKELSSSTVYSCGSNALGTLGAGTLSITDRLVPAPIVISGADDICATNDSVFVVTAKNDVYSFGSNAEGILGHGTEGGCSPVPKLIQGLKCNKIATGFNFAYALSTEGKIYSWGCNNSAQLGISNTTFKNKPFHLTFFDDKDPNELIAGNSHGFIKTSRGDWYGLGYNGYGQLGNGTNQLFISPIMIPNLNFELANHVDLIQKAPTLSTHCKNLFGGFHQDSVLHFGKKEFAWHDYIVSSRVPKLILGSDIWKKVSSDVFTENAFTQVMHYIYGIGFDNLFELNDCAQVYILGEILEIPVLKQYAVQQVQTIIRHDTPAQIIVNVLLMIGSILKTKNLVELQKILIFFAKSQHIIFPDTCLDQLEREVERCILNDREVPPQLDLEPKEDYFVRDLLVCTLPKDTTLRFEKEDNNLVQVSWCFLVRIPFFGKFVSKPKTEIVIEKSDSLTSGAFKILYHYLCSDNIPPISASEALSLTLSKTKYQLEGFTDLVETCRKIIPQTRKPDELLEILTQAWNAKQFDYLEEIANQLMKEHQYVLKSKPFFALPSKLQIYFLSLTVAYLSARQTTK